MEERELLEKIAQSKTEKQTSELKVFTVLRKLVGYIVQATDKSPKKFKASFVDRMRNLGLTANGVLVRANLCRLDDEERRKQRRAYQIEAYEALKELESISFLALECKCIVRRQYTQISKQIVEALKFLTAWIKSDKERVKKYQNDT